MVYRRFPIQAPFPDEPRRSWGPLTRFLEIGEDGFAVRHVDVYANGYSLRYDRDHWVDGFGILADMRYDARRWEKWWGPGMAIDPSEFEAVWEAAALSPARAEQLGSAKMSEMGAVPVWLTRAAGHA